jgi:hypothetical protein
MIGSLPSLRFYIRPKSSLLSLLEGRATFLADLLRQTWECDIQRHGRSSWDMKDYETQAKVSVLARVYDAKQEDLELFTRLFGMTSDYAEDIFDRNWTIERNATDEFVDGNMTELGHDAIACLPRCGRPNVDYWLERQKEKGGVASPRK